MNKVLTKEISRGSVTKAFGNLLQVKFEGSIRQGEVAMVHLNGVKLKGEVLEIEPDKFLKYTTIDPHSDIDDVSENYLDVTYELIPQDGKTLLKVTQGDYSTVADGEKRYQDSYNNGEGWNPILVEIKKLVEAQ